MFAPDSQVLVLINDKRPAQVTTRLGFRVACSATANPIRLQVGEPPRDSIPMMYPDPTNDLATTAVRQNRWWQLGEVLLIVLVFFHCRRRPDAGSK